VEQTDGLLQKNMNVFSVFEVLDDIGELDRKQFQGRPKRLQITRRITPVPHPPTDLLNDLSLGV